MRQVAQHFPAYLPPLLFLTDPQRVLDPVSAAQELPPGSGLIYRHFGAADRLDVSQRLAETCERGQISLLIAADPELACQVEADGVHWPEARLAEARAWRGYFRLHTASAHSARALNRARRAGMDAALVSTVFASNSVSAKAPVGVSRLHRLARQTDLPIYALGGVTAGNAGRISDATGLAAIEGLLKRT